MRMRNIKISPRIQLVAAIGAVGLLLSGCTTYRESHEPTMLRNKITVAETVERLELYTQPSGLSLSARDQGAVRNFIAQYGRSGQGPLYINVPYSAAGGLGTSQAKNSIVTTMREMGLPNSAIQFGQYTAQKGAPAPVVVSFRQLKTAPIDCNQGSGLTYTSTNQPYVNFGCAQTANLAAMAVDPRQFLAPYGEAPIPAARRTTVMDNYVGGQPTATPRPQGQEISAGK